MLKLAWNALKDARQGNELDLSSLSSNRGDFANGALLSLGNPLNIVFWTGLGTTVFSSLSEGPEPIHFAIFFAGFLGGALLWCFLMAALVAWGRKVISLAFFRWINLACGLTLAYFAARLGWLLVRTM